MDTRLLHAGMTENNKFGVKNEALGKFNFSHNNMCRAFFVFDIFIPQ
jgi:hypothetical protein